MNKEKQFDTPILLIIYRRPKPTAEVFEVIRKLKPKKLFIAAGAPQDIVGEKELCDETKKVTENIDWGCDVQRLYEKKNVGGALGCKNALDWFFNKVEEGIVLEDDCLPDQSFFPFCAEMLERYRKNERVMIISGENFQNRKTREGSYYFSKYPITWGWACWKRVWNLYDFNMKSLPVDGEGKIREIIKTKEEQRFWLNMLNKEYSLEKKWAWDYQLLYTMWTNNGIGIIPGVNLISNIGFGEDATNTKNIDHPAAFIPLKKIEFPLIHPNSIKVNDRNDYYVFKYRYIKIEKWIPKILRLIKKIF